MCQCRRAQRIVLFSPGVWNESAVSENLETLKAGSLGGTPLPDEFVAPAYEGYSLANVAPTVVRHFGIGGIKTPPPAAEPVQFGGVPSGKWLTEQG